MIFTYYYCTYSLFQDFQDQKSNFPCKSVENFILHYKYLRKNYPDEDILIIDNASPIGIKIVLSFFNEYFEFIDKDRYSLTNLPRLYIKSFKNHLDVHIGCLRPIIESVKFAYRNRLDCLYIESDSLLNSEILTSIYKFKTEFASLEINSFGRSLKNNLLFLDKDKLHIYDNYFQLDVFFDEIFNNYNSEILSSLFTEGGFFNLFCFGRADIIKNDGLFIHNVDRKDYLNFLINNPLDFYVYDNVVNLFKKYEHI